MQLNNRTNMNFDYIKRSYEVPAEMYREVIVNGKKGVITEDMGNYIGVNFYENPTLYALPCHPTWEVQYLDTFNRKPPVLKVSASKKRYQDYLRGEWSESFGEYLKLKLYKL
jgi:hypothetical protein